MADKSKELETLTENMKALNLDPDQTLDQSPISDSVSENVDSNGDESNPEQEQQTLPILKKFEELSSKVMV
ncbi:hypothetical protein Tco_1365144, partial [Tanacetum coccineum]